MAGLSSPGVGSGLDINGLVSQLVAAEKAPAQAQITRSQTRTVTTISALGAAQGRARCIQHGTDAAQVAGVFLHALGDRIRRQDFHGLRDHRRVAGQLRHPGRIPGDGASAHLRPVRRRRGAGGRHRHAHDRLRRQVFPGQHRRHATTRWRRSATPSTRRPATTTWCAPPSSTPQTARTSCCRARPPGEDAAITVAQADGDGGLARLAYNPSLTTNYTEQRAAADSVVFIAGFEHRSATNTITDAIEGVTHHAARRRAGRDTSRSRSPTTPAATTGRIKNFVDAVQRAGQDR